jgi:hypothetical protein
MRNLYLIFVLVTGLLPFVTTQAAPADLPQTGQTICYDATGAVVTCAGTGQDGELMTGAAWPSPRFVVGPTTDCITDTLTGLVWVRAPVFASYTWNEALTYANNLNLCGYTDWRLPNIIEIKSVVNSAAANKATFLNTQGFNVYASPYWSSTNQAGFPANAWYLNLGDGNATTSPKDSGGGVGLAWPVRAGQ